jgi:hypothetical protein
MLSLFKIVSSLSSGVFRGIFARDKAGISDFPDSDAVRRCGYSTLWLTAVRYVVGVTADVQLSAMLGAWEGEEELFATAWTAAGTARGKLSVAAGPGGGLIVDYTEDRDGAMMTAHGVVSAGGWWWFDSYGFTPAAPGTAEWRDGDLVLTRSSERGRTVTVLRVLDGRLEQEVDTAGPADGPLVPLLRGRYARQDR